MRSGRSAVALDDIVANDLVLRRYLTHRHLQQADVDDVVQETLTRLMEVADRLESATLTAYALTTANNLLNTERRRRDVEARHLHRLVESPPMDPDDRLIVEDEHRAVAIALESTPQDTRQLLLQRYSEPHPAREGDGEKRSSAVRLSRARARLRVDVALNYRRTELPSERCRQVLIAISERDQRRQVELRAGHHLLACRTCAELCEVVLRRQRRLLAFLPLTLLVGSWRWMRLHPLTATAGAGVTAAGVAAAAAAVALSGGPAPAATPAPTEPRHPAAETASLCAVSHSVPAMAGRHLTAQATVLSVPSDEGFFVATCRSRRVWVRLSGPGESPITVRAGDRLSLSGTVLFVDGAQLRSQGLPARDISSSTRRQAELQCSFHDVHHV